MRGTQAFIFSSAARSKREKTRNAEREQRRLHVPIADRGGDEPPPFVVLVHGPPQARRSRAAAPRASADVLGRLQVGKSTLIKSLVKHYTRHNLSSVKGPITVVSGKQRRLQLVECGPELNNMARSQPRRDFLRPAV